MAFGRLAAFSCSQIERPLPGLNSAEAFLKVSLSAAGRVRRRRPGVLSGTTGCITMGDSVNDKNEAL